MGRAVVQSLAKCCLQRARTFAHWPHGRPQHTRDAPFISDTFVACCAAPLAPGVGTCGTRLSCFSSKIGELFGKRLSIVYEIIVFDIVVVFV